MTYKNAVAGLDLGGGKSVIIGDPERSRHHSSCALSGGRSTVSAGPIPRQKMSEWDVEDMEHVRETTRHVAGLAHGAHASGDPSPTTAKGIVNGLRRAVAQRLNRDDLGGLLVAVQGLGHVGWHVCSRLHEGGAKLIVSDIDAARVERAVSEFGATACAAEAVLSVEARVPALPARGRC